MIESEKYKAYLEDQKNDTIGAGLGDKYLPYLEKLLPISFIEKAEILDIGPGPFTTFDWFLKKYNKKIYGVDLGQCLQERIKSWPPEKQKHLFWPVDAHFLLETCSVETKDLVLSFHSFEHMYDLPLVLDNVFKVLKPKGYLYFSLPIPSFNLKKGHWYDIPNVSFMKKIVEDVGFSLVSSELISDFRYRPEQEMVGLAFKE